MKSTDEGLKWPRGSRRFSPAVDQTSFTELILLAAALIYILLWPG